MSSGRTTSGIFHRFFSWPSPVLQENHSRQCTAAVTGLVEFLAVAAQVIIAVASHIAAAAVVTVKVPASNCSP